MSEAAPYWHFADREALLAAVAERGFTEMAKGMMATRAAVADPRVTLVRSTVFSQGRAT